MPVWVAQLFGLLPKVVEWLEQKLPTLIAYFKGRQDQKMKDKVAGLEDALDRQRETSEAAREMREDTKDRVIDREWLGKKPRGRWRLFIIVAVLLTGCGAVAGRTPRVLPPVATPMDRPVLLDSSCLTDAWVRWIGSVVKAYEVNCAVLKTERGEDPATCEVK